MAKQKEIPIPLYEQFANDVVANPDKYSILIRQAVDRYNADKLRKDLYFDHEDAQKHIEFVGIIPLVDNEFANKPLIVQNWQAFLIANIYGWKKKDGTRKHKRVYLQIPRRNSKTTVSAALSIDNAVMDPVAGGQILYAATSEDQAKICFDMTKRMCDAMCKLYPKSFGKICRIYKNSVEFIDSSTVMKPVINDPTGTEGRGPKMSVADEVHLYKNGDLLDSIRKGMASSPNPLLVMITTAGYNKAPDAPAYQFYEYSKKILNGTLIDDSVFTLIFQADDDDDWKDVKTWYKANPNLGLSPKLSALEDEFQMAINLGGAKEVDFKIKHLNMWVDSEVTWISKERWEKDQLTEWPDDLPTGRAGLDLASVSDFCSLSIEQVKNGISFESWKFYLPEETLKTTQNENYRIWAKQGFITVTPGNATDYNFIKKDIAQMMEDKIISCVYYDRYNSSQLVIDLHEEGVPMIKMAQTASSMHSPIMDLERLVYEGKIQHKNNPVATWMLGNVRIIQDENGNCKITKGKSNGKVDGIVSMVMARKAHMENLNTFTEEPTIWIL